MPLSSTEAAAMAGSYQQMAMGHMQYAGMIGGSMRQGVQADGLMGGALNRAYATGAPIVQGLMGAAGIDPFSLGMKAASSVWAGGGGVLGAGMAGIGMAGGVAGLGAAAGYMGNQMFTGAQQQQQLNGMLRQNFPVMTPNGQGMNRSDMASIGSSMRSMTHQAGPGGETVNFGELTQLAANMGKMGMGQGIRDAQQFSTKFREMLTTLKSVASELGTTLDGAQQFLSAQRSSGVFKAGDQARFASSARSTSLAGGLALSEVTGAASIGSQISRSMGGLGRSGAFGGMRAIGQVGSAMQTGALSEEDVYNTTGLTGAEGRQAMATSMMEQTGRFLRGSKGRYFLASVAGKNGHLDENSVQNWMAGGMDVGETKKQANENLSKVGRANFIRNEGRLRGEVLERFGAMAPTMALSQWASGKGVDINNMDDRSMLFAQRQLGMGRDEIDSAVKMAQGLPEIMRQQRLSKGDDDYGQRVAQHQRTHGVEGMKRKLDQIREGIQGKLQQVGADIFTSGADMIDQWFNKMSGVYERRLSTDVDEVWKSAKMGGRGAQDLHRMVSGATRSGGSPRASDIGRWDYDRNREMKFAAGQGANNTASSEVSAYIAQNNNALRDAYTTGLAGLDGEHRINELGTLIGQQAASGNKSAMALSNQWNKANSQERASMAGSLEKTAGISDKVGLNKTWDMPSLDVMKGTFSTVMEGDVAVGREMIGEKRYLSGDQHGGSLRNVSSLLGSGAGFLAGKTADLLMSGTNMGGFAGSTDYGNEWGRKAGGVLSGGEALSAAAGEFMRNKSRLVGGLASGDKEAQKEAQDRIMELQSAASKEGGMEHLSNMERGEFSVLAQTSLGAEYGRMGGKGDMKGLLGRAEKMLGREAGSMTEADLQRFQSTGREGRRIQAEDQINHLAGRASDEMTARRESLLGAGVAHYGTKSGSKDMLFLDKATKDKLLKSSGEGGVQAAEMALTSMDIQKEIDRTDDPAMRADGLERLAKSEGDRYDKISGLSTSQKKGLARGMAGTDIGAEAGESLMREQRMNSLVRSQGGGAKGQVGAIASQLGLSLSKDQLAGLAGKNSGELSSILSSMVGDKSDSFKGDLQKSIDAMKSGKVGVGADPLQKTIDQADASTKKKIKEGRDGGDPVVDAIRDAGNKQLEMLKLIAKNKPATAEEIAAATSGNTEAPPKGK